MITIKQIAALSGVSQTTVSNVIHGRTAKVSDEKKEKIEKILKEQNYVANMGAQIIGNHGSRLIALVFCYRTAEKETLAQDPFASSIIGSVELEIRKHGYFMILYNTAVIYECLQMARAWNIEGMIIVGAQKDGYYKLRDALEIPVVSIDTCFDENDNDYVNIGLQDLEGMSMMTDYLISMGHREIGFMTLGRSRFGGAKASEIDLLREKGYRDSMMRNGIVVKSEWITPLKFDENERIEQFADMARTGFYGCSALFFASDQLAMEAMMTFRDQGVRTPDSISIAGFDDIKLAHQLSPGLTTVHQDFSKKGECAVTQLMKLIKGENVGKIDIKLPVRLMIRETVRKYKKDEKDNYE